MYNRKWGKPSAGGVGAEAAESFMWVGVAMDSAAHARVDTELGIGK